MKNPVLVAAVIAGFVAMTGPTWAQEPPAPLSPKPWHFEVTPYAWLAGLNADITVGSNTAEIDLSFGDLVDAVSFAGSIMAEGDYNKHLIFLNGTFFSLDTDNLDDDVTPAGGGLEQDIALFTAAIGQRFPGLTQHSNFDVLAGVQTLNIENTLTLDGIGEFSGDTNVTDFVIVIRPSMWLHKRLRFNSTISLGGGDSDFTFETSPQLQIFINKNIMTRIGFRQVNWNIEGDASEFDGGLRGFLLGLGGSW